MSVIGKLDELKKTPLEFSVTYTDSAKQKDKYKHTFCLDLGVVINFLSNAPLSFEIPYPMEDPYKVDNQQLSQEEFNSLLDELADISMKFTKSDVQPLSDYAVSREGIYEGHPKL